MKKLFYIKKRGFTLIELLAVIVILAIILLIIMPIILNIINDARKGAFEASARGIIKAVENDCVVDLLNDEVSAKEISFSDYVAFEEVNYAGRGPKEGTIYVNETCEVAMAVHDGQWCVIKDYDDTTITTFVYEGSCTLGEEMVLIFGADPASLDGVDFFDGTPEQGMIVFKTPGDYEITPGVEEEVEVLVVGGGGAGGVSGGRGGGGDGLEFFGFWYAGGGAGGHSLADPGSPGLGGGGAHGQSGIDNTGGGGGGHGGEISTGGTGIVIIRWGGYDKNYDPADDSIWD